MEQAAVPAENPENTVNTGVEMLRNLCDNGFDGSLSATALVLGRDAGELEAMLDDHAVVDEDLIMKIRGVAEQRGIDIS